MKTIKEQADELVEQKLKLLCKSYQYPKKKVCINLAILSTKNTIEVLQNRKQNQNFVIHIILNEAIAEQTELLKELKSRI